MACCYDDREGGDIVHAEIHYLTPSAWRGELLGGLGQPPEYYHPHYITHEAVHFFQYACCRTEARARGYRPPSWITEGMAESDGYRHTTEYSRSTGIEKLNKRVLEREVDSVVYGQNLLSEQALVVSSVYWAGGWVMNYLAERYGDEIHVEMLGHNLPEILSKRGTSIERTFHEMAALVRSMRPEVSQPGDIVRARHLMEIRRTIEAQLPSGVSCGPWTDDPIVPGVTPVKATHINEIRGAWSASCRDSWLVRHVGILEAVVASRLSMPNRICFVVRPPAQLSFRIRPRRDVEPAGVDGHADDGIDAGRVQPLDLLLRRDPPGRRQAP